MKRGIAFMDDPRREARSTRSTASTRRSRCAVRCRPAIPAFQDYLLAACLLNRADALVRLNDATPLAAALESADEAIEVLSALPMDEDPLYPRRLAIGCQNSGCAAGSWSRGDRRLQLEAFADAIAGHWSASTAPRFRPRPPSRSGVAQLPRPPCALPTRRQNPLVQAREAATRALACVGEAEAEDVQAFRRRASSPTRALPSQRSSTHFK